MSNPVNPPAPVHYEPRPERWYTAQNYELHELDRLDAQLEAIRAEYRRVVNSQTLPGSIKARLEKLGRLLEGAG